MHERRFSGDIERLRSPQRVARLEVDRVVELCLAGLQVETVLDVGTGSGLFAESFVKRRLTVSGIDPNLDMIEAARRFAPAAEFRQATVEVIPFADKAFDLVFLGLVLHEADDPRQALTECRRCARQRVAVLEWPYKEEETGPPLAHRLQTADVEAFARQAGFRAFETLELTNLVLHRLVA
jgi:ubiquinone/menaquinone biosynthesis C-methylase UbiE